MNDQAVPLRRQILFDNPNEDDAFSGGGHRRTAESLARTIQAFDDRNRTIGLEGKWGAGKSTIIEIAKKHLADTDSKRQYHVFTFDLWANQTSNFRRAFLEELLLWLERDAGGDVDFIKKMRSKIRNKTIETETTNTSIFSGYGVLVLIFGLLLPAIYMWISPFALLNREEGITGYTIIAISIILFVAAATAFKFFRIKRAAKRENKDLKVTEAISQTLSVFSKEAETTNITQNIREIDPTQHEFEETIKKIISSFQTEKRRIIIVFDNIDRLPSDKIGNTWSDIRTVFASNRNDEGSDRKLTSIVPYDRGHILSAVAEGAESLRYEGIEEDEGPRKTHEDIFRKSFDVIFSVAPPIISDANTFFSQKFKDALEWHSDDTELDCIYKIFDLSMQEGALLATPRQIISFINSITTLWEQWRTEIPLATIAVYSVHAETLSQTPGKLRHHNFIKPAYRELARDARLDENLAALTFNVPADLALQVLLHGKIESAFTGNDSDAVEEISKSPGFDRIMYEVFSEKAVAWASNSPTQFANAVNNLVELDIEETRKRACKPQLLEATHQIREAPPENWENLTGILKLFTLCSLEDARLLFSRVALWLQNSLPTSPDERTFNHGRKWIIFIGGAFDALAKTHSGPEALRALKTIELPLSSEFLVGAAFDADATSFHIQNLKSEKIDDQLVPALEKRLIDTPLVFLLSWRELSFALPEETADAFLERLANHIKTHHLHEDTTKFNHFMQAFIELSNWARDREQTSKVRQDLVNDGALYHHIFQLKDSGDLNAQSGVAHSLWIIISQVKGINLPNGDLQGHTLGNLNESKSWVQEILYKDGLKPYILEQISVDALQESKVTHLIEWSASEPEKSGLTQEVLRYTVRNEHANTPAVATVVKNYDFLKTALSDDLEKLLELVGKANKQQWEDLDPASLSYFLVEDVRNRPENGWRILLSRLDEWLKSIDAETWRNAIFENSHTIDLLHRRVEDAQLKLAPDQIREPISDHVISLMVGETHADENFDNIVSALPTNSQKGLATDILDRLDGKTITPEGIQAAIEHYSKLMSLLPFDTRADITCRKVVLPAVRSVLYGGSEGVRDYLENQQKPLRKAFHDADSSVVGEILEAIGDENSDDDLDETRKALRKILGLTSRRKTKDKDADGGTK